MPYHKHTVMDPYGERREVRCNEKLSTCIKGLATETELYAWLNDAGDVEVNGAHFTEKWLTAYRAEKTTQPDHLRVTGKAVGWGDATLESRVRLSRIRTMAEGGCSREEIMRHFGQMTQTETNATMKPDYLRITGGEWDARASRIVKLVQHGFTPEEIEEWLGYMTDVEIQAVQYFSQQDDIIEEKKDMPFVKDASEHKNDQTSYPAVAQKIVFDHVWRNQRVVSLIDGTVDKPAFSTFVVWFCFILGGWKALVATTFEDGRYYEVTYNKEKDETYLDVYTKVENTVIRNGNG